MRKLLDVGSVDFKIFALLLGSIAVVFPPWRANAAWTGRVKKPILPVMRMVLWIRWRL
jgi:hypothetical protein